MKNNLTSYSLTEESLGETQAHTSVWCLMGFWSIDIRSFHSDKKALLTLYCNHELQDS